MYTVTERMADISDQERQMQKRRFAAMLLEISRKKAQEKNKDGKRSA